MRIEALKRGRLNPGVSVGSRLDRPVSPACGRRERLHLKNASRADPDTIGADHAGRGDRPLDVLSRHA